MFTGLCSSNPSPKLIHNIHIPTVIPDFLWYRTSPVRYNIRIGAIQHHYRSLNQNSYALSLSKALVNKVSTLAFVGGGDHSDLSQYPLPKGAIDGHLQTWELNIQNLHDTVKLEILAGFTWTDRQNLPLMSEMSWCHDIIFQKIWMSWHNFSKNLNVAT